MSAHVAAVPVISQVGERSVLRQLAAIVRPWRGLLGLVAVFVVLAAVLELVPPLLVRSIIDDHLSVGETSGLLVLASLYLGATATTQLATFAYTYLAATVAQRGLLVLRTRLFAHLQQLPLSYHDQTPLGDSISRCTADVETVDTLFSSGVATLLANMVRLVTVGAAMLTLSLWLSLVAALVVPPLVLVTRFFQVRVRAAERDNRLAVGLLNTHLQESLSGVEVIRAFGREGAFVERVRRALRTVVAAFDRSNLYSALYTPTTAILSALVVALLLWAGTREAVSSWNVSLGTLAAFVLLFQRFFTPITDLGDQWQTVQAALSGAERIFEVLALPAELRTPPEHETSAGTDDSAITLRDVTFGYNTTAVLHDVSLTLRRGEHVAIIGRTGAGKTSILQLLAGLYAPWSGSVRVAGIDPRTVGEHERPQLVAVVPQVVQLFTGTVRENVTLGAAPVAPEAVDEAARVSGADRFIEFLPQGYETLLDSGGRTGGVQLSAGQQQLLALTRALALNAPVLLLDEATAAVDAASDASFRATLRRDVLSRGLAVLTVAHRLSTAREADRVIVLEAGRIVEQGAPQDLIARGGRFASMLELEAAGWDWRSAPTITTGG
jgi:ATP-binding cassette subfamily B protein